MTYLDNCLVCHEKAQTENRAVLGDTPTPLHPWHTVGMDLLQLPSTRKGNRYLFVLIDILTRYCIARPLSDKTAEMIASTLKRRVFEDNLLGPPVTIVSDNGLEFCNATVDRLLNRYGIKHVKTTPYNPKGNGATERMNRTILGLLRGALSPGAEWDGLIQTVVAIYNNTPHSATGITPYEAMTGRPPRHVQIMPEARAILFGKDSVVLDDTTASDANRKLRSRFANRKDFTDAWEQAERQWESRMESHFGDLHDQHGLAKFHRTQTANKDRDDASPEVGDMVVIRDIHRPPGVEGKLRRPYLGPWVIIDAHKNRSVSLSDLEGNVLPRAIPLDQVRPWRQVLTLTHEGDQATRTASMSRGGGCSHPATKLQHK